MVTRLKQILTKKTNLIFQENKNMYSILLVTRKKQVKITLRHYF